MADDDRLRCLRCGADMDLRDPAPGMPWAPVQYWVCANCGRHFWTAFAAPAKGPVAGDVPPKKPDTAGTEAQSP